MAPPPKFKGVREENFRVWMRQIEDYFRYHSEDFSTDDRKITWLARQLSDRALTWYQDRQETVEKEMRVDNWQAFKSQMSERFINKYEVQENILKMQKLMYRNDIDDYLVKMNLLNACVEGAGPLYHEMIRAGLPTEIKTHMAYGGEEPDDTTQFLEFVRRMGKRHEKHQRMTKGEWKDPPKDTKEPPSATRPLRQPKFNKTWSTPSTSSKTPGAAASGWKDKEEWLKGVPAAVRKARHEKDQCARCGTSDHKWFQCTNRIIISAGGGKKRKVEGSWRHGEGGP